MKKVLVMIIAICIAWPLHAMEKSKEQERAELREKYRREAEKARQITEQEKKRAMGEFEFHRGFKNTIILTPEAFVKAFPALFTHLPPEEHQKIVDYAAFMYGDQAFSKLKEALAQKKIVPEQFKWKALGFAYNVVPYKPSTNKYFYFEQDDNHTTTLKGTRNDKVLREYLEFDPVIVQVNKRREELLKKYEELRVDYRAKCSDMKQKNTAFCIRLDSQISQLRNEIEPLTTKIAKLQKNKKDIGRSLVEEYKIHLMPDGDLTPVIIKLLKAIQNDLALQHAIAAFKVLTGNEYIFDGQPHARVVIYPTAGKANAQFALQKIYELFKDTDGLGERPRFNAKVNDLIWIAQGDSIYKRGNFLKYYEAPNYVYYNPEFMGAKQNYHLLHPQTQQEIVY